MKTRKLGANGPDVSAIALGCMSFAGFYGATNRAESLDCLAAALDHGIDFLDTANVYGAGLSEEVIGEFIKDRPNPFKIATKGGIYSKPTRHFENSEPSLRKALEESLTRLGVDYVDLYYVHRREQEIPIEDVTETLVKFIDEGKIGGFGYSEISPASLRRAHAVHPVMAVQNEYSLWTRYPELGLIQTCKELGTTFVPFSPLARGMFGEVFPDPTTMLDIDFRRSGPRFQEPNYAENCRQIAAFREFANDRGWTTAGAAIAWVLDQGDHMIPIPGTRSRAHLAEWATACEINFTDEDRAETNRLLPVGFAHGDRYNDQQIFGIERYS